MKYQLALLGQTPITNEGSGSGTDDSNVAIAGIVSSCVVIFILLVSLTILIARWRKKKANSTSGR